MVYHAVFSTVFYAAVLLTFMLLLLLLVVDIGPGVVVVVVTAGFVAFIPGTNRRSASGG